MTEAPLSGEPLRHPLLGDDDLRARGVEFAGVGLESVSLVGGPAPYREALTARLNSSDIVVADTADVLVICCVEEHLWTEAAAAAPCKPTVAVVADLDLDLFVRALALGAGVVHLDTPTDVMLDVIRAAFAGEALLPLAITQALARFEPPRSRDVVGSEFEGVEELIVSALLAGRTVKSIAAELNYSDRTIRRKLQGIYLKLGVADREAAVQALRGR